MAQAVSDHIFPPLANIVGEYNQTRYHLLSFDAEQMFESWKSITDKGVYITPSELDAARQIIANSEMFRRIVYPHPGVDYCNEFFSNFVEDMEEYRRVKDDVMIEKLQGFYEAHPEKFLKDINQTWVNRSNYAWAIISEDETMYKILVHTEQIHNF